MIYFFYGPEDYNIELEIQKLKNTVVDKAFISTNYRTYDSPQFPELMEVLRTPALMFGSVLAVVNCEKYFNDKKDKINFEDKELKEIENALEMVQDGLNVVFVCRVARDGKKGIDTRRKLFKLFSKYGKAQNFPELKPYEAVNWLKEIVKKKGLIMAYDVQQFFVERVGTNLHVLDNELEKLKIALYPTKTVKKEDIINTCSATENVFLLTDYILDGKKDAALREFRKLCTSKHYLEILAVLQTNFAKYADVKVASLSKNPAEIAADVKISEYMANKYLQKLKSVPMDRIIKIRQKLLEAEYRVKTGEIAFYELPVELAVLS